MTSTDKLTSEMEDLTTDATPIPQAEVAASPTETVFTSEATRDLPEESDSQESELEDQEVEERTLDSGNNQERDAERPVKVDEVMEQERLSSQKGSEEKARKISEPLMPSSTTLTKSDKKITKSKSTTGQPSVVYHIEGTNVHLGSNVTVNVSGSQTKSQHMAAPKKTKEIKELLQSRVPVTEEDIDIISRHVGRRWRDVGRQLRFTEGQLDQFKSDFDAEGLKEVIHQMLLDWMRTEVDNATCDILCRALWSAEQYDPVRILARSKTKSEN